LATGRDDVARAPQSSSRADVPALASRRNLVTGQADQTPVPCLGVRGG
jgi:hypothetical protein